MNLFSTLLVFFSLAAASADAFFFLFPNPNPVELQRQTFMGVLAKKMGILDFYANLFRGIHGTLIRPFQVRIYNSYQHNSV